jgi:hypothetical protein
MTSGALVFRWFVRRGQFRLLRCSRSFPSVLLSSWTFWMLRWMMPGMTLGEAASRRCFTWRLSLPM